MSVTAYTHKISFGYFFGRDDPANRIAGVHESGLQGVLIPELPRCLQFFRNGVSDAQGAPSEQYVALSAYPEIEDPGVIAAIARILGEFDPGAYFYFMRRTSEGRARVKSLPSERRGSAAWTAASVASTLWYASWLRSE